MLPSIVSIRDFGKRIVQMLGGQIVGIVVVL